MIAVTANLVLEVTALTWRINFLTLDIGGRQAPYLGVIGICNETIASEGYFSVEHHLLAYQFFPWYRGKNLDQPERPVHCIDLLFIRFTINAYE